MKNFTDDQIQVLGVSQAGAALFSLVSSVTVILTIILLKRHKRITQRLIMYLNIAIFFNSTSFILRGLGYTLISSTILCKATGYYGQMTGGLILSSIWCIIIEIVLKACGQKDGGKCIEVFYLILIFLVPPIASVIPFIKDGYGESRAWCWIQTTRDGETYLFGVILQYVLWYIPLYTLIMIGGIIYSVGIIAIGVRIRNNSENYSSDVFRERQKQILKEFHQFRWYPITYFLINLVPLANRLYDVFGKDKLLIELWIAAGVIEGLQGIIVAVLFFADHSTRKLVMEKACYCCMKKQHNPSISETTPISGSPYNSYEAIPSPFRAKKL